VEERQELVFPRACDAIIDQAIEKAFYVRTGHPRGHQAAAEHNSNMGELLLEEADHRKGAEGLAQIIEGKPGDCCPVAFNNCWQALAEIFVEGVSLWMLGSVEEILTLDR